jgi:hypothetical protein
MAADALPALIIPTTGVPLPARTRGMRVVGAKLLRGGHHTLAPREIT